MTAAPLDWVRREVDECVIDVDGDIYGVGAVMRACYRFTDQCYVFIERIDERFLRVRLASKTGDDASRSAGELSNALLDEQLRAVIAEETRAVRDLLYLQAFAEAEFEDRS